jgi:hypothetical protein
MLVENLPKNQKEYYHNKIREFEKRTGKSMNVKGVSKIYDCNIEDAEYNTLAAMDMMKVHGCYIYYDLMTEEDIRSNGTNWLKYSYAHVNGKTYKYYYETKQWGQEIDEITLDRYNYTKWKAAKLDKTNFPYILDPGEDYLPYALENKHIGSNFDDFAKENNIELKRDINWAVKMVESGKMVSREGNPSLTLFPKKYDHAESTITTTDLFAEDWVVVQNKTFKDVLDDLNAGKTIRRKSWHSDWGVGKYARYGKIIYLDLIADDWEVEDVVSEVNKQQEQILKDRNEH